MTKDKDGTQGTQGGNATATPKPAKTPRKKTAEEIAALPSWQQARINFANLPDQRQVQSRIERALQRGKVHLRRIKGWRFPAKDANGGDVDAAAEARRQLEIALAALDAAGKWVAQIPDDWKPTRAASSGGSAAPLKTITAGSQVKLKGAAAKAEPEYATGTVTFLEKYGDDKHLRARCQAPDGTKFACAYRDLNPA